MTRPYIEVFLPVFMLFFLLAFLAWNYIFRNRVRSRKGTYLSSIIRINQVFLIMLGLAVIIVGLYSFHPDYYNILLLPIDALDKPFINETGGLILRVAFFWLLSSMIHTYLLFKTITKENQNKAKEIYIYAQKIVLVSVALLLVGLAVTISSVGAFLLSSVGLLYYYSVYYQTKSSY